MDSPVPDVTFLMPCLNEAKTLPTCIDAAHNALRELRGHGLHGEILISDNGSTDGSQSLAAARGCRVVHCSERGYGATLRFGIAQAHGRFIVIGDSDASYDFREGVALVLKLQQEGYDLCMGNRFAGGIRPGAMPWKNHYIGNPILSGVLNLFYRTRIHDAHCGLRAFTKDAFHRMRLNSPGMEFASEMVVKAALAGLRCTEVPISLHKDGRDRPPHLNPWRDGLRHLHLLLMLSPLWVYFIPATILMVGCLAILIPLSLLPPHELLRVGPFWFGDHWLVLAVGLFLAAFGGIIQGLAALVYTVRQGYRSPSRWGLKFLGLLTADRAIVYGMTLCALGALLLAKVLVAWGAADFGQLERTRQVAVATLLGVTGVQTVFAGFLLSLVGEPSAPCYHPGHGTHQAPDDPIR